MIMINNNNMLGYLPWDLQEMILEHINLRSIKAASVLDVLYTQNNRKIFAVNRIKLWWRIQIRYYRLRRYILQKLISDSYVMLSGGRNYYRGADHCVYYAPFTSNGMCRTCNRYKKDHRFKSRMIEKFFIPLLFQ